MPELPDITVYVESLSARVSGRVLRRVRVLNPFVLRTAVPPIGDAEGRQVVGVERLGKRVVLALDGGLLLVIHLMIAGRLKWLADSAKGSGKASGKPPGEPHAEPRAEQPTAPLAGAPAKLIAKLLPAKGALAAFEFDGAGTLTLTEAGTQRRASLHLLPGREALAAMDPGGIDVMAADAASFHQRLVAENHTLKRALTDPRLFSGIGNAYSDEILHRARMSPMLLTRSLDEARSRHLLDAAQAVLAEWTTRLRDKAAAHGGWPGKVTAFHPQMAVHGRHKQPCPVCGAPVQRIVHADNETNYCARCQTGGKLLADRALSRLLKEGRPRHIDEL